MPEAPVDPFATAATVDPFAAAPADLAEEVSAEIPTVNREGDVIAPPEAPQEPAPAPAVPEPVATTEAAPEPPQEPAQAPAPPPEAAVIAAQAAAVAPPAEAAAEPPAPAGARSPGPRGGKGEMRYYKLFYLSSPDTYTVFDLASVPDDIGVTVCRYAPQKELDEIAAKREKAKTATGEEKAKLEADARALESLHKELWFEARNNEHANRLAFAIMGRPKEGAQIFPIPRGAWKPKTVKPAPPAPARERVVIS